MKVVLSPSKSMSENTKTPLQTPLFDKRFELLKGLQNMTVSSLVTLYQSNEKIATENYNRFQAFKESNQALFTYTGQQFKHLDVATLDQASIDHLNEVLYIMSGLYGLVRPYDKIGLYRLPMGVKWNDAPLKNEWMELISDHLKPYEVLNLASKEYYDAIDHKRVDVTRVDFLVEKNGKIRKAPAMEAKKMRGLMLRKIAENKLNNIEAVKSIKFNDYSYDISSSQKGVIAFLKQ